jgi:hypothetical protein
MAASQLLRLCVAFTMLTNGCIFGQDTNLPGEFGPHLWTATVKVVGEDGNPIAGADAAVQYSIIPVPSDPNQPRYGEIKGTTDTEGMFSASHTDSSYDLGVVIDKAGYYATQTGWQFYYDDKRRNPSFTLVLKKNGKPIAMYAKWVNENPPVLGQPIGYDLMVGDWVCDGHKGISRDIVFQKWAYRKSGADYEYKVKVAFPKDGDGIQIYTMPESEAGSGLRSPHEAPLDGYQPELNKERSAHPGQSPKNDSDPNRIYLFRVRTAKDHEGNIVSAYYGKIYGDFMQFTYYLNPTSNDRNIEFDPKQNLLGGLQSFEQVDAP